MPNKSYSSQFKYEVVKAYKNAYYSVKELINRYQIPKVNLCEWVEKFDIDGVKGFETSGAGKQYSKELKEAVVRDYLSGGYSQYELSGRSTLRKWINKYNSHRELKDTSKGRTG